jgi:hypothetical protein
VGTVPAGVLSPFRAEVVPFEVVMVGHRCRPRLGPGRAHARRGASGHRRPHVAATQEAPWPDPLRTGKQRRRTLMKHVY